MRKQTRNLTRPSTTPLQHMQYHNSSTIKSLPQDNMLTKQHDETQGTIATQKHIFDLTADLHTWSSDQY